jgi:hypothetical protein
MLLQCILYWAASARIIPFGHRNYYDASVNAFIEQYKDFEAVESTKGIISFDGWYAQKQAFLNNRFIAAKDIINWQYIIKSHRQKTINGGRDARMQSIRARVATMHPRITLNVLRHCKSYKSQYDHWEPLTERAWTILQTKIIAEAKTYRVDCIKDKAAAMIPKIHEALLTQCDSFWKETDSTDALTTNDWAILEPKLRYQANAIMSMICQAQMARIHAIRANLASMPPGISNNILSCCPTWRKQFKVSITLTNWALKLITAIIRQEAAVHIHIAARRRMFTIKSAINEAAPYIDDNVIARCPTYKAQYGQLYYMVKEELDMLVNIVQCQARGIIASDMRLRGADPCIEQEHI